MNATSRNGFLGPAKSAGYSPKVYGYTQSINSQRPYFQLANVPEMLQDEQIQFGLGAIYAPLNRITWETKCDKPEVKQFIDQQIGKVLTHGLQHLRRCVEYGQIGAEVLYTTEDNRIVFDSLVKFEALDTTPLELESKVVGVRVRGTKYGVCDIGFPRFIWTVNQPIGQGAIGVSRLSTAWIPWIEKGGRNGARDIVRLHMIRNSSRGDSLYYPEGQSNVAPEGASPVYVNNQDLARQLVEQIMAGGTVCFPNGRDEKGEYQWVMKPPVGVAPGEGLLDWLKRLDHDILRGMKVPPEVLEATGETGSGYAGRSIPMDVFYNSEDELVRQIVSSVVEYIIRWLVWANFGRVKYTVTPKSVAPQPPQMPGQGQGAPAPTPGGGGGGSQADPAKVGAGKPVSRANTGWQPYHGPRGGQGFYNPKTGRVRYGRVPLSLSRAGRNPLLARVRAAKGTNTKALAEFHAGLWNMLLAGGLNVPDAELEKVAVELARGPWAIIFDKKHGRWAVVHSGEEDNRVQFAIRHSPVGGVNLRGVFYRGGEFIPDDVYDSLNANERAELERSSQASTDRLAARGDVTRESVQQRTGRYAKPAQGGKITADELQQAKGLAHAIHRQYGELSLHRLDEIAEYLENAANALPASESGLKAHYQRRLGVLHHAATNLGGMVKRSGLLGGYKVQKSGDPKMPYQVTRARDNMAWMYKDRKEAVSNARRMFQLDKDVHARTGPARPMPADSTTPADFAKMMAEPEAAKPEPAKPTGAEFPAGDFGKMMGEPAAPAKVDQPAEAVKPASQIPADVSGRSLSASAKAGVLPAAVKRAEDYLASLGEPPPPPKEGMVRLYRGTKVGETPHEHSFFTDERGLAGVAIPFAKSEGRHLAYVDVPRDMAEKQILGGAVTDGEYLLPEEYRKQVKPWGIAHQAPQATKPAEAVPPTEPTVPKAEAQAKEPWQMTRGEYSAHIDGGGKVPMSGVDIIASMDWGRENFGPKAKERLLRGDFVDTEHLTQIANALRQGKSVPADVLAEYPDLTKKSPPADPDAVDVPEPAPRSDRQKLIADLKNRRDAGDLSDKEFGQHLLDILDGKTPDLGDAHEGDVTDVGDFGGFDEEPAPGDNVSPRAEAANPDVAPAKPDRVTVPPAGSTLTTPHGEYTLIGQHPDGTATVKDQSGQTVKLTKDAVKAAEVKPPEAPAEQKYGGGVHPDVLSGKRPYQSHGEVSSGWKLHLASDRPDEVSAALKSLGLHHKVGRSGQEGKDLTVYIGHKDQAAKAAKAIEAAAGHLLKATHGDALKDDLKFTDKVAGRFDVGRGEGGDFHQYGDGGRGIPWLNADMDPWNRPADKEAATARADAELKKRYGEFYTGSAAEPEQIPGGTAAGRPDADFAPAKLAAGAQVEAEHTPEPDVAEEIAKDHLAEDPDYYAKLKAVEAPKAATAPPKPFTVAGTTTPISDIEFLRTVAEAAKAAPDSITNKPPGGGDGTAHKPFISDIYSAAKDQLGGMSLDDFRKNLLAAHRAQVGGTYFLSRLDHVPATEDAAGVEAAQQKINDSKVNHLFAEFHRVDLPNLEKAIGAYDAEKPAAPQQASEPQKPAEVPPPPGDTVSPRAPSADQHLALADALAGRLAAGSITAKDLWAAADQAYGGTRAEGAYGPSEAYDALEAGFNKSLAGKTDPGLDLAAAQSQAREIADRVAALPTQTNRSGTKDSFHQFSTPPHYAYAVNWIANPKGGDLVLEPSAGTASLAVHAQNGGADVVVNELDPRRAGFLKAMFGPDKVHTENADHLDAILSPRGVKPTVVVMNPPFSQTAGRMGDKKDLMVGANHIEQAFKMLPEGGRLVAIVGRGMTPDAPTFRGWFAKMGQRGTLRANVGVGGNEYSKYGTRFGTRVLVFDKAKSGAAPVLGDAADIPDLMAKLEGVRNDRPQIAGSAPGQPAGGAVPGTPGGRPGPGGNAAGATAGGPPQPVADGGQTPGAGGGTVATPAGPGGGVSGAGPAGTPARTGGGRGPVAGPGGAPELAPGGPQAGAEGERRGGGAGGELAEQPRAGGVAAPRLIQPAPAEPPADGPKSNADLGTSLYETYRPPFVHFEGAQDHKTPLVESAAMSAVDPPQPKVTPNIPKELITKGKLSNAQLENLVYATQAHETYLPAGPGEVRYRRGHMNGDGTGVGKGRQNAAIIIHNFNEGRRKAIWLSLKANLIDDAARDWTALGMSKKDLHPFRALKRKKVPQDGVLFVTYDTLRDGGKKAGSKSNLQAVLDWLGPDFDGVMIMDEAHAMGNAMPTVGGSGRKRNASLRATAGVALQEKLPEARVEYASATGATEVANLAYAQRLGLWGRGTPFPTAQDFINQMTRGGTAAMEQVAQSLKATGAYNARSLSFDGVTYQNVNHALTPDQHAVYDAAAEAWQTVIANIDNALEAAGAKGSRAARMMAESQLWSAQQRFFNQLITAIMTPTVINSIESDLKNGLSPVVQLINTGESATNRALKKRKAEGVDESESLEDLDVGPRDVLIKYLDDAFPVQKWEEYVDPQSGAKSWRKVTDSEGNYVVDPEAVQIREQMKDMVMSIRLPEAPLDMIVNHFGPDAVAEATGRKKRIVWQEQSDGTKKKVQVSRGSDSSKANAADTEDYQAGRKKIMVFSAAGGTGKSYHSDRDAKNQKQRTHYILQAGWQADAATQGFGRTHRTNQASPPIYKLMTVDKLKAQKRFVSSIARRLEQLGALTKGQRQTGGGGMFSAADNLESPLAMQALSAFWQVASREGIGSMTAAEVMRQLAFKPDQNGTYEEPTIRRFLNRMLSTSVDVQNQIFDAFNDHIDREVQRALDSGTLDTGVENFKAQNIAKVNERVVYTEPNSGAKVRLLTTKATRKTEPRPWESNEQGELPLGFVTNNQSGKVYAVYKGTDETDAKSGNIIPKMILRGVLNRVSRPAHEVRGPNFYSEVGPSQAKALWQQELAEAPATTTTDEHFLVGATLPIWDRIPGADHPQIFRIRTDDGQTVVGRHVTKKQLPVLLRNLGAGGTESEARVPPHETIHAHLSAGRGEVTLANGWRIRPVRVQGEKRIELTGPNYAHERELMNDGVVKERIRNDNRLFIPVGRAGVEVLRRITASRPIAEVGGMDAGDE